MPRRYKPRWHAGNQQWVSDCGAPYTDASGRTRRRTVPFPGIARKDEKKAREALQAYLDQEEKVRDNSTKPTVATIFELYLEWVEVNRELSTFDSTVGLLKRFASFHPSGSVMMAERRADSLEPKDLERFLLSIAASGLKPSYGAVLHAAVNAAFNWAAKRDPSRTPEILLATNPFKGVAKPKVPRSPERYAERAELAAFLRWAWRHANRRGTKRRPSIQNRFDRQFCQLIRLAAHTGARPGELCITGKRVRTHGFTWDRWNPSAAVNALGQPIGLITHDKHKTASKTGRKREIVVPPILVRMIERLRSRPWSHPTFVFSRRRGKYYQSRGATTAAIGEPWTSHRLCGKLRRWRALAIGECEKLKAAGKPTRGLELIKDKGDNRFVLYRLRHTRATDLIGSKGGLSHDQAAALLGTSGRMIETTYGHLTGTRLIELDQATRMKGR